MTTETEISIDDVMTRRFELDEQIAVLMGKHKAELAPMMDELKLCETFIKDDMIKTGAQQWKSSLTGHMTFWTTKDSVAMRNWEEFIAFVEEQKAWHLLNRAANKTAVKELIEAQTPPPGVEYTSFRDLAWRRGKLK